MYITYTTPAFVLQKYVAGESDMVCVLYTKDFGLISARATGVRLQKSKLRSSLQTLMHVRVSLVRGVREWRITGVDAVGTVTHTMKSVGARVALLLTRLVRGSERNESLFVFLHDYLFCVAEQRDELFLVAGVLFFLGYIDIGTSHEFDIAASIARELDTNKQLLLQKVNEALHHSHL